MPQMVERETLFAGVWPFLLHREASEWEARAGGAEVTSQAKRVMPDSFLTEAEGVRQGETAGIHMELEMNIFPQ